VFLVFFVSTQRSGLLVRLFRLSVPAWAFILGLFLSWLRTNSPKQAAALSGMAQLIAIPCGLSASIELGAFMIGRVLASAFCTSF